MKKIFYVICSITFYTYSYAQPIGTPPSPNTVPNNANSAWYRGGNFPVGSNPATANIFGTFWNSEIHTYTNSLSRTRLNGTLNATVSGVNKNFDGYFGISPFGFFANNTPRTMLHLSGKNNAPGFGAGAGWRLWMETGLLMNENSDGMYVGLKEETGTNRSDAIINWSDDPSGGTGPDKLRFIHTGANTGNGNNFTQLDPRDPFALDGYEYMRMTAQGPNNALGYASGHIGIGPMFTQANFPQARLHMHSEDDLSTYLQISNNVSTGISATDGLRLGILGAQNNLIEEGHAFLYNQEQDRHLLFSTGYATPTNIASTSERLRLTSFDAPTTLPSGLYGNYVPDPANAPANTDITRMSISHDPLQPVTRPLSLLHLGYNTGNVSIFPGATDGWRAWMDIGMFTSNGTDNMYVGLKREKASATNPTDRHDAIINWGDNQAAGPSFAGPDHMRFVFTATQTGTPTTAPANGFDGLEAMRMTPTLNTGVFTGVGGDPNVNQYFGGSDSPTNTFEINSWGNVSAQGGSSGLRFTELNTSSPTLVNPGLGVLAVDAEGDVIYVDAPLSTGLGNYCTAPTQNPLIGSDYEIPLNSFNYRFTGAGLPNTNSVSIGLPCGIPLPSKLGVYQNAGITTNVNTIATGSLNQDVAAVPFLIYRGVYGEANGVQTVGKITNIGGEFRASNADANIGVRVRNFSTISSTSASSTGGDFLCDGSIATNVGITAQGSNAIVSNIGVQGLGFSLNNASQNIGGYFHASGATVNYGIYSTVNTISTIPSTFPPTAGSYAAYFNGSVIRTGNDNFSSDLNLKTDIDSIQNALNIIDQLNPSSFYYDTTNNYGIAFSSKKQYGFIAQEIESILPELVGSATHPASYDSLGNIISPAYTYKTLQYNSFIGILTKGIQELKQENHLLQEHLIAQDSINNALQDQINTLYGMITACCNNSNMPTNNSMQQNQNGVSINSTAVNVTLSDNVPSIVLDQNVPNPFAEQTTITYTLTEGVQKAQMLFYNIEGKLIQSIDLSNAAGQGQINVFANDLSTGVYTYSLVVDGQIKGTKRMIKN